MTNSKLTFETLAIELTRRCNMACPHCMRGKAQNIDIDRSYIDALLEQAELIGQIFFAGGEPMLNLPAMEYVADKLCENGIPLLSLEIITNGLIFNHEIIRVIKRFRKIIDVSCGASFEARRYVPGNETQRITIGVSMDRFHEQGEVCRDNFKKYQSSLSGCAVVIPITIGNSPISVGRAKTLQESLPCINFKKFEELRRIEILDKDHIPACKIANEYRLFRDDQRVVCCEVYLTVHGALLTNAARSIEYERMDQFPQICKADGTDVWQAILDYNQHRIPCNTHRLMSLTSLAKDLLPAITKTPQKLGTPDKKLLKIDDGGRCARCKKVIVTPNGQKIHCAEVPGGLQCEYCGTVNRT